MKFPQAHDCMYSGAKESTNEYGGKGNLNAVQELRIALEESVKLQSHYAEILNSFDGGKRMTFENAEAWLARLRLLAEVKETK